MYIETSRLHLVGKFMPKRLLVVSSSVYIYAQAVHVTRMVIVPEIYIHRQNVCASCEMQAAHTKHFSIDFLIKFGHFSP